MVGRQEEGKAGEREGRVVADSRGSERGMPPLADGLSIEVLVYLTSVTVRSCELVIHH